MENTVAYLSQQWCDEAEKRLKAEITPEKMKRLTSSVAYVYVDCPDGRDKYLYFKTVDGTFAQILVGEGEPPESEFRVTGPYDLFAALTQGKIKSQRALMSGKLKLKGNMVKALKLASLADRMNKIFEKIPARY
ncbi:MAG TPA: SCP2 sterol-binding domain-containing protein [Deltaproteobacteria bacterium]|nr:SCP2 sterol-binding domain-containing protein [Deltaproteobacteria bacterium]HPR55329.1 SCP2 sterol-binding domain-containing protein [Deltaproteobacteria bacterium]HXK47455.1 SCP2 sterol-binding domain-containing protein [Deltaproteobacteria bacterium]